MKMSSQSHSDPWPWIQAQFRAGNSFAEISRALASAGIKVPEATIRTRKRREGWTLSPSIQSIDGETVGETVREPNQPFPDTDIETVEGSERRVVVSPSQSPLPFPIARGPIVLADAKIAAITQRHDANRDKVVEAGLELIEGAVDALRELKKAGPVPSKDLKSIGDALARAADMLGTSEDRERKAKGLDRPEVVNPQQQGITQILINVQAPPVVPIEIPD